MFRSCARLLLSRSLAAGHPLVSALFPDNIATNAKKRPETAGSQFKRAVTALIDTLRACQPHYIRCIKSNDEKRGGRFDVERVRHQVHYLNLVETVRVRKAGYASRQHYTRFLWRYKMLSDATWPTWNGTERDGVKAILTSVGVPSSAYELGVTKVFIKEARTFVLVEQKRQEAMPKVAVQIQKVWKGYKTRVWFRQALAELREERRKLEELLRQKAACNAIGLCWTHAVVRRDHKKMLTVFANVASDRDFGKQAVWPTVSAFYQPLKELAQRIWLPWWGRSKVLTLNDQQQLAMRQKIAGYDIFHGKKPWACARAWTADYVDVPGAVPKEVAAYKDAVRELFAAGGDTRILFADVVEKLNPKLKSQARAFIVTESNLYKYDPAKFVQKKDPMPLAKVVSIALSPHHDALVVIHMQAPWRDIVLDVGTSGIEKVSELVTVISEAYKQLTGNTLYVTFSASVSFNNSREADDKNPDVTKKPGVDCTVTFAADAGSPKWPEGHISQFEKGKANAHRVVYRSWQ